LEEKPERPINQANFVKQYREQIDLHSIWRSFK